MLERTAEDGIEEKGAAVSPISLLAQAAHADVQRIGIPRALLYYRYGTLWTSFFEGLGRTVVLSPKTDRAIVAAGEALSIDECCLASKVYLGHVEQLREACDAVFVPSMGNLGKRAGFCTKYQALPDLVANTFRQRDVRILSCLVDQAEAHVGMDEAFADLGAQLGASPREAKRAYRAAQRADQQALRTAAHAQEQLVASLKRVQGDRPLAILLVAHPYVAHDPIMGGEVADALESLGATVLFADEFDREQAYQASFAFSETMPWIVNRELIGALTLLHDHVDGVVLVSAFPCGPDSMTDDAILRCIQGKPILNLTIDAQSGAAGLETRVESFVDILRYQKKGGYLHDAR